MEQIPSQQVFGCLGYIRYISVLLFTLHFGKGNPKSKSLLLGSFFSSCFVGIYEPQSKPMTRYKFLFNDFS